MALGFALNNESNGGDFDDILKWDAKAGDLIRVDRFKDASGDYAKNEEEVKLPVKFAADLGGMEVGWLSFASGRPDFAMAKIGTKMPERPSQDHKEAARFRVYNKELGVRAFSHSAKTVLRSIDALHDQYIAECRANPDKLPVIEIADTETVKINTPQGELRFKIPAWKIVGWTDRPAALEEKKADIPAPPAYGGEPQPDDADLF